MCVNTFVAVHHLKEPNRYTVQSCKQSLLDFAINISRDILFRYLFRVSSLAVDSRKAGIWTFFRIWLENWKILGFPPDLAGKAGILFLA